MEGRGDPEGESDNRGDEVCLTSEQVETQMAVPT